MTFYEKGFMDKMALVLPKGWRAVAPQLRQAAVNRRGLVKGIMQYPRKDWDMWFHRTAGRQAESIARTGLNGAIPSMDITASRLPSDYAGIKRQITRRHNGSNAAVVIAMPTSSRSGKSSYMGPSDGNYDAILKEQTVNPKYVTGIMDRETFGYRPNPFRGAS